MRLVRGLLCAALAALALPAAAQETSSTAASSTTSETSEPMAVPPGYRLVWADEFAHPGAPDPKKWRYDTSRNKAGWYNQELQYYAADRRENVRIENGNLVIEARNERLARRADFGGQDYTSGKIFTRGIAEWTHGFVEVRARLACGRGIWPAIWMLGSDPSAGWPALGEIDIMEHVGWDQGRVHGTIHTKAYNHVAGTQRGANTLLPDACAAFHRYQLDWSPERILIGVDGRAFMRFDNDHKGDLATWPFDKPQYLILNVAVGGWGGQKGIDPGAFPARMEVDYVRVWQGR
jgi:beta-glucanase (GH16 family)